YTGEAGGRVGDLKCVTLRENVDPANPRTTGAVLSKTFYTYDQNGNRATDERVKFQRDPSGNLLPNSAAPMEGGRLITAYHYDAQNRLIQTTDPTGATTDSAYNSAGKLVSSTDRYGATTRYFFDPAGESSGTKFADNTFSY